MPDLDLGDFTHDDAVLRSRPRCRCKPDAGARRVQGPRGARSGPSRSPTTRSTRSSPCCRSVFASLQPVEDRPVRQGDFVLMDLAGSHGRQSRSRAPRPRTTWRRSGDGNLIPGFEEALEGVAARRGEEFDVTFPDDYHAEELQGEPATFERHGQGDQGEGRPRARRRSSPTDGQRVRDHRGVARRRAHAPRDGRQRGGRARVPRAAPSTAVVERRPSPCRRPWSTRRRTISTTTSSSRSASRADDGGLPRRAAEDARTRSRRSYARGPSTIVKRRLVLEADHRGRGPRGRRRRGARAHQGRRRDPAARREPARSRRLQVGQARAAARRTPNGQGGRPRRRERRAGPDRGRGRSRPKAPRRPRRRSRPASPRANEPARQ